MRELATIRRIAELRPIEGADLIECAVVDGWTVVVKKGDFKVGDLGLYFEIDSFIPHEVAPFLTKAGQTPREYEGIQGQPLRTVRLRGQLSQGLLLPITHDLQVEFSHSFLNSEGAHELQPGTDLTDILGIQKWEKPMPAEVAGLARGQFPSLVPKTDEERIQNMVRDFPDVRTRRWEVSEKLEGSSMTVAMLNIDPDVPNDLHVCSRNLSLKESDTNSLWMLVRKHDLEAKMIAHGLTNVAIQGEIVGPGIEGNHYKLKEPKFFVFRMYDISKGEFLEPAERREWCSKLDLPQVPLVAASVDLEDTLGITTVDHVIKFADGKSQLNPNVLREGLVFKEIGGQWHWKVVSNEYLLTT